MTRVYAHRGDARAAKENTLDAFAAAVAAGAHGVELDVRRTIDGALVVHHDAAIDGVGAICDVAVRDLPADVALLAEAMDVLGGVTVNVEIKNGRDEPGYDTTGSLSYDVVTLLEDRGDLDRVIVSSFDLDTLDAVRQACPEAPTGLLLGYSADPASAIDLALAHGYVAVHPFVLSVTPELLASAHAVGLDVNTWTVNARHDLEHMGALGVDVVITDDVGLALEVLEEGAASRNGVSRSSSA